MSRGKFWRVTLATALTLVPLSTNEFARAEVIVIPPPPRPMTPVPEAVARWGLTVSEFETLPPTALLAKVRAKERRSELEKMADHDPVAALILGLSMVPQDASLGLEPDVMEAFHWISVAAQSRHWRAQATLALIYDTGYGVPKNERESARLLRLAADQGDERSMFNLANAYYFGRGLSVDQAEGLKWSRAAAAKGHARAMYNVGYAYFDGKGGVDQNYAEALSWFQKAAAGGAPKAMYMLGYMHQKGLSVSANEAEAFNWYRKAAAAGDKSAIAMLGPQSAQTRKP